MRFADSDVLLRRSRHRTRRNNSMESIDSARFCFPHLLHSFVCRRICRSGCNCSTTCNHVRSLDCKVCLSHRPCGARGNARRPPRGNPDRHELRDTATAKARLNFRATRAILNYQSSASQLIPGTLEAATSARRALGENVLEVQTLTLTFCVDYRHSRSDMLD